MTIGVLPIAGRPLTDSLTSIVSFSSYYVLNVGDFDVGTLPIVGRPATIK